MPIVAKVGGDPHQPWTERAVRIESIQRTIGVDKGLLGNVLRIVRIAQK